MVERYLENRDGEPQGTPSEVVKTIKILAPENSGIGRVIAAVNAAVELFSAQEQKIKPLNK